MSEFDLTAVGTGLAQIAALLEKLRKGSKDKATAEIVGQFQEAFFEMKTKAFDLYVENSNLKAKLEEIKSEHAKAMNQIATEKLEEISALKRDHLKAIEQIKPKDDDVSHRGAFFKRKPAGGYFDDVLCRKCRNPMVSLEKVIPFMCRPCNITLNFNGLELPMIMLELPK